MMQTVLLADPIYREHLMGRDIPSGRSASTP